MAKPVRSESPTDDLGELADYMLRWKARHKIGDGTRAVIFLENNERCMTALDGWESDLDAVVAVIIHLKAVFEANGKTLIIAPLNQG